MVWKCVLIAGINGPGRIWQMGEAKSDIGVKKRKCPNCGKNMENRTDLWGDDETEAWYCGRCDEPHYYSIRVCPKCGFRSEEVDG
jgi:ribosomal protein S27AE